MSIHLLANDTGCVSHHTYDEQNGEASPFRSGYVNAECFNGNETTRVIGLVVLGPERLQPEALPHKALRNDKIIRHRRLSHTPRLCRRAPGGPRFPEARKVLSSRRRTERVMPERRTVTRRGVRSGGRAATPARNAERRELSTTSRPRLRTSRFPRSR